MNTVYSHQPYVNHYSLIVLNFALLWSLFVDMIMQNVLFRRNHWEVLKSINLSSCIAVKLN